MPSCRHSRIVKRIHQAIFVLFFISMVIGCNKASDDLFPTSNTNSYKVRGVAVEISKETNIIRINHEEIPNFMKPMTMPFTVKRRQELKNINEGDQISFELIITDKESWIEDIKILTNRKHTPKKQKRLFSISNSSPLRTGDELPNYSLINQDENTIELSSFKGRVLIFTFIYTRCPIPDFCPRMTQHFLDTLNILKERSIKDDYHFLSISFDPDFDNPKRLRNYSKAFLINNKNWSFATGNKKIIDEITSRFGITVRRTTNSITDWDHNLRTIITDTNGIIKKIYIGNSWTPEELAEDINNISNINKKTAAP